MGSLEELSGFIWLDGKIIHGIEAKCHIAAHSLHYGGAVYEGIRIYNHKAFKLQEHNARLHKSAELLGFQVPYDVNELNNATNQLIELNQLKNGYIRPFAWRGGEELAIRGQCSIHAAIIAYDPFGEAKKQYTGLRLEVSRWEKISPKAVPAQSKAGGLYMMATVIQNEASRNGFDGALLLDSQGYITEATTANFFFIKNNILYTPIPDSFLDGITRQTVINEIATHFAVQVIESKFTLHDLEGAEAAFLTGTAAGIAKIASIHNTTTNQHFDFSITNQLLVDFIEYYDVLVGAT